VSAHVVIARLAVAAIVGLGAPAWAQSKRYPPQPIDRDAEQAARSTLWNAALTPERHSYQDLVRTATEALNQHTTDQTLSAITMLDTAVRLLPHEADAYRLRGDAQLDRRAWDRCAADFAAAETYMRRDALPPKAMAELRRKLGICQARAGKLSEAEKTLAETAASGNGTGEVWTRLGEVRIAMGKLEEAIAALHSAIEHTDPAAQAIIRFLLAAAYDRARRPADALFEAGEGLKLDRQLVVLQNPVLPPVSPGDLDYMLGLAYTVDPRLDAAGAASSPGAVTAVPGRQDPARPEYALAYFRKFVKAAPDSQWRKRADDHIRELRTSELPDTITGSGTSPLPVDAARTVTRRMMPQMRACLAGFPTVVVEVEISKAGPRTPATDRMRPRFFTPPDGVTVRRSIGEISDGDLAAVDRCLQPFATRLPLPAIKERDTYYKAMFYVVGP